MNDIDAKFTRSLLYNHLQNGGVPQRCGRNVQYAVENSLFIFECHFLAQLCKQNTKRVTELSISFLKRFDEASKFTSLILRMIVKLEPLQYFDLPRAHWSYIKFFMLFQRESKVLPTSSPKGYPTYTSRPDLYSRDLKVNFSILGITATWQTPAAIPQTLAIMWKFLAVIPQILAVMSKTLAAMWEKRYQLRRYLCQTLSQWMWIPFLLC